MIVRLEGREIECSVDEYRALFPDRNRITGQVAKKEIPTRKGMKLARWTKQDDKFLRDNIVSGEKNYFEASEFLNRSENAVYTRCVRLGLVRAKKRRRKQEAKGSIPQSNASFPSFKTIAFDSSTPLKDAITYLVKNKGDFRFLDAVATITPVDGGDWDKDKWADFLDEFIRKSKKVAKYFGIRDNFVITETSAGNYLTFGN